MKKLFFTLALFAIPFSCFSQKLEADVSFFRVKFYEDDQEISGFDFREKIEVSVQTKSYYRKFRVKRWWGGFMTTFGIINGVAAVLVEDQPTRYANATSAAILLGGGYLLKQSANRSLDNAFELYYKEKEKVNIGLKPNGIYFNF